MRRGKIATSDSIEPRSIAAARLGCYVSAVMFPRAMFAHFAGVYAIVTPT